MSILLRGYCIVVAERRWSSISALSQTGSDSYRVRLIQGQTHTGSDSYRVRLIQGQTHTGSDSYRVRLIQGQTHTVYTHLSVFMYEGSSYQGSTYTLWSTVVCSYYVQALYGLYKEVHRVNMYKSIYTYICIDASSKQCNIYAFTYTSVVVCFLALCMYITIYLQLQKQD